MYSEIKNSDKEVGLGSGVTQSPSINVFIYTQVGVMR